MTDPLPLAEIVPLELGGKWLAWNDEGVKIVAVGDSADEAKAAAEAAGVVAPILEKAPSANSGFIGRI